MDRYARPARLLHWLVAVLVVGMATAGVLMVRDGVPSGLRDTLFVFHKNVGVLVLLLVLVRAVYRWFRPPPPGAPMPRWQALVAGANHAALYALLLVVPVAGYLRVRAGGFPIEALDAAGLPSAVPRSEALAAAAQVVHHYAAWALVGLAGLHVAAALYHGLLRRDGILGRMWPPV